jgi:hypothetical protein
MLAPNTGIDAGVTASVASPQHSLGIRAALPADPICCGRASAMQGEKYERWIKVCAQAAVEQDPKKLLALAEEIDRLLEEKERRLGIVPPNPLAGTSR